ncbi:hypothetical protein CP09DC77_1119, partial [Chlamydia psittaci 09DC77]
MLYPAWALASAP